MYSAFATAQKWKNETIQSNCFWNNTAKNLNTPIIVKLSIWKQYILCGFHLLYYGYFSLLETTNYSRFGNYSRVVIVSKYFVGLFFHLYNNNYPHSNTKKNSISSVSVSHTLWTYWFCWRKSFIDIIWEMNRKSNEKLGVQCTEYY